MSGNKFFISVDCDDVNPGTCPPGCLLDSHLYELNDKGYRPTVFVPAYYEGKYNLSHYTAWVEWMKKISEIQAHGLFHIGGYGACEFLKTEGELEVVLTVMKSIYEDCGIHPTVLRPPGWLHNANFDYSKYIKHLSVHDEKGIEYINIHELREPVKEYVILHSHASPPADNDLSNPELFKKLLDWLKLYKGAYTYITVGEMYDRVRGNP
jgi:hypothetical protein